MLIIWNNLKLNEAYKQIQTSFRIRKYRYFGAPGSGPVIICTDPDPSINKQKNQEKP
jgi:hypothetical protein